MTEKQYTFHIDECGVYYYICDGKEIIAESFYKDDAKILVDLLNKQEERKESLHKTIVELGGYQKELIKENKQLKQFIDKLTTNGRINLANGRSYKVNRILIDFNGDIE